MREQIACERMFTLASLCKTLPFTFLHWFKVNSSLWYGTNDLTERPSFPSTFPGAFTLSQTLCQTSITPQAQLTGPLKDAIAVFCHEPQVFQVFGTLSLLSSSTTRDVWDFQISRIGQLCVFQRNGCWSTMDVTGIQRDDVLTCSSVPQGFASIFDRFVLLIRISWCYWYTADRLYVILMEEKKNRPGRLLVCDCLCTCQIELCTQCLFAVTAAHSRCTLSIVLASHVSRVVLFQPS